MAPTMINCQIIQDGKIKDQVVQMSGLVFRDNHGVQRTNHIDTPILEASLNEGTTTSSAS